MNVDKYASYFQSALTGVRQPTSNVFPQYSGSARNLVLIRYTSKAMKPKNLVLPVFLAGALTAFAVMKLGAQKPQAENHDLGFTDPDGPGHRQERAASL